MKRYQGKHIKEIKKNGRQPMSLVKWFLITLSVLLTLAGVSGFIYAKILEGKMHRGDDIDAAKQALTDPLPNEPIVVLILGTDARDGERGRTDTIMLARFDTDDQSAYLISIPRDARVQIPGRGYDKINAAYAYGGVELTIRTVKEFTGFDIHHFIVVNFQGFEKLVDAMGGIEIYIDEPMHDSQLGWRFSPGLQTLDGEAALRFVRIRSVDDDFGRMRRQQKFLSAVADKLLSMDAILRFPRLAEVAATYTKTDLSLSEMVSFGGQIKDFEKDDIQMAVIPGQSKRISGISYVIVDEGSTEDIFFKMRNDLDLDKPIPKSAVTSVMVLNGTGETGLAGELSRELTRRGIRVTGSANADSFDYQETYIYYQPGSEEKARRIKVMLGLGKLIQKDDLSEADLEIVVGQDHRNIRLLSLEPERLKETPVFSSLRGH